MRDVNASLLPGSCKPKTIELPYKSRDPGRLAKVMEPTICDIRGMRLYTWRYCRGLACRLCLVLGSGYRVVWERVSVPDRLSGLREHLRVPSGLVDEKLVWKAVWNGTLFLVEDLACDIVVKPSGTIVCRGDTLPSTRDSLLYCVNRLIRGP